MHNLQKRFFFVLVSALLTLPAFAQYNVKLKLVDSDSGEPVAFATVSLTPQQSTKPSKYILSDDHGTAKLEGIRKGSYTLKAELLGYKVYAKDIVLEKNLDLGEVKMKADAQVLDAATASAVGNPIIVKKDTVEYNASSFKTTDNDMLEELLKKLPGIEVDSDGKITSNGQEIKKITIDGKTFFLDDPSLASKNLPAKIIEKVKVVEKMSDQAQFTGIDDGERETVIDLSIRPGMMNGWFGNLMAGGGHDLPQKGYYESTEKSWKDSDQWRYQGAGMVGRFTNKSQISLILNANNTNNRGFNDMAGSMMGNMRGGGGGMGRFGGWGNNSGITSSWMGGLNGAFSLLDGKMDLGANYLYNGTDKYVTEESSKISYLNNGEKLIYDTKGYDITKTYGNRFGMRLEHKFSDKTSILFEPQVNFGGGHYQDFSEFQTYSNDRNSQTNGGFNDNTGVNKNWSTSGFALLRQRLNKPGRTISVMARYSFSQNKSAGLNQSLTENFISDSKPTVLDIVNQRVIQHSNSSSLMGRVSYTEPVYRNLYLEAYYSYSWNRNKSIKDTWDSIDNSQFDNALHPFVGELTDANKNDIYSNSILNQSQNHNAGATLQYQKDKLRAHIGASVQPAITDNTTSGKDPYHSVQIRWSPQAMLSYDFNDNADIRMFYRGRSSQPSTSQLIPVPDNSNPLNVSFGNPALTPYFNHSLNGHFGYSNKKNFFSLRGGFSAGLVQNPIVNALWYDGNGAQYNMPMNGPSSGNASLNFFVNAPFGQSGFSLMNMTRASYSQSSSYLGKDNFDSEKYYDAVNAEFNYDLFNEDFNSRTALAECFTTNTIQTVGFTERLRLTFRKDFVELNLGARTRFNKSWYTVSEDQLATWNNRVDFGMTWTIPGGITAKSDINYDWYVGYTTPQESEIIWNAEISKLLFKKTCTLAVKAYDIMNQAKNISITDNANYHQEVRNNTLGRYIIISLTYRFGTMQKGSGRGPMGGSGRPPMGPPPGR